MLNAKNIAGLGLILILPACGHQSSNSLDSNLASVAPSLEPSSSSPTIDSKPSTSPCVDRRSGFADKAIVERICFLVNEERKKVGAQALTLDSALSSVAQAHAEDMVRRNYFSHDTPEGLSPFDRMTAAHISYQTAGENIAYSYKTPEEVMQTWMNSPGHKANILNPKYGKIGVGYFQNDWVQDFTN